jgi:hypothetical protein
MMHRYSAQQGGPTMYGKANEADAYNFMWSNSFRNGEQWKENFAWVTSRGVLVLPVTSKSTSRSSDFGVLSSRKANGDSKYNITVIKSDLIFFVKPFE